MISIGNLYASGKDISVEMTSSYIELIHPLTPPKVFIEHLHVPLF